MKKLSLATVLFLSTATIAFADSNTFTIQQASVGANGPSANFTQSGSGANASVIQNGNDSLIGVQTGTGGTKFTADQENPTGGAANTINYTGSNNSNTVINQAASYSTFTANASVGNTANVSVQGYPDATYATPKVAVNQAGYNNSATVNSSIVGYTPITSSRANNINVVQLSDNANSGNQFTGTVTSGLATNLNVGQIGGNKANVLVSAGVQDVTVYQINTADNIASANVENLTMRGAEGSFVQNGTNNTVNANLGGSVSNAGVATSQTGDHNLINAIQNVSYLDAGLADTITQTGSNNTASGDQEGTHNSRYDITQNGVGNNASVLQSGTNNLAQLTQTGNNNTGSITQNGNSNLAQLFQTGNGNNYAITQNGNNMNLTIHQN